MEKTFEGKVHLWGKDYPVKVVNGERLTKVGRRWLTTDDFVASLSHAKLESLAFVGRIALNDEKNERPVEKGKYEYIANKLSSF